MKYIGCKRRLLPFIHNTMQHYRISGYTFCDLFAGTGTVGNYFKQQGYRIISNDLLYCSYVQQQVKVAVNKMPSFSTLAIHLGFSKQCKDGNFAQAIIDYLNQLTGIEGFIYKHYSPGGTANQPIKRMYYTDENAKKIDVIREQIEAWKQLTLINDEEFYVLLYALLKTASQRANTTGMQNNFIRKFYPEALKPLNLTLPSIIADDKQHKVYCGNSLQLIHTMPMIDILYLDPPYTRMQYASAYHLLETIARWDCPVLHGVAGYREATSLYSTFNSKRYAFNSLKEIVMNSLYRHLLLSYSSDGIISHDDILYLFNQIGDVAVKTQSLTRYNSMSRNDPRCKPKKHVEERLYYLKPHTNSRNDLTHCNEYKGVTLEQLAYQTSDSY